MGGHLCRSWPLKHWASAFTLRAWLGMCRSQSCFREGRRVPRAGSEETAAPGRPDSPLSYTTSGINRGVWNRAARMRSEIAFTVLLAAGLLWPLFWQPRRSRPALWFPSGASAVVWTVTGQRLVHCAMPGNSKRPKGGWNIEHSRAVPESERAATAAKHRLNEAPRRFLPQTPGGGSRSRRMPPLIVRTEISPPPTPSFARKARAAGEPKAEVTGNSE